MSGLNLPFYINDSPAFFCSDDVRRSGWLLAFIRRPEIVRNWSTTDFPILVDILTTIVFFFAFVELPLKKLYSTLIPLNTKATLKSV